MERVLYGVAAGRRRDIVLLLHREGPLTLAKLRAALGISASTLLFELSALESLGVVKREDSMVYLTELGERAASIIATAEPLKTLSFLSVVGLRPLVVWLLLSPYLHIAAYTLVIGWAAALAIGAFQSPPLALLGVAYVGYNLPISIGLSKTVSLAVSLLSIAALFLATYLLSKGRLAPPKTAVGLAPIALYPSLHLTLVHLAHMWELTHLITLSQVLLFIALLFTATIYAAVYSLEVGSTYEGVLVRTLLVFFVAPALLYLAPIR
ncbi:helix-turn-helix domain-containing protein [Pyrobaculum neutrophilum]|uniref:Transcriptional regulator, ArsR family n=1 Tax=Pyrobaculum neutrophilum (strain DSM 2338 / JCM 9278 / NBRC 100436 / V24Sta) TaxID=444157 RepID=B1Y991_PYRNV|nr:helix-turn-helix domain-containing protein [Pyrobaculum neutrophilum]ACB40320.1 transcriptional regulator, ArsR family [Pyrobaculum neutrophilum V24Sta]